MQSSALRTRSSLLEALELFRQLHAGVSLGQMIAFLYVAENEGLTLADLAEITGFYLATASRTIRSFAEPDADGALGPALGLIEVRHTGRGKAVFLTAAGANWRAHLNRLISAAVPIRSPEIGA